MKSTLKKRIFRVMGFLLIILAACTPAGVPRTSPSPTAGPAQPTQTQAPAGTAAPTNNAPAPTAVSGSLPGTSWALVSYGAPDAQVPVVNGSQTTLAFGLDGQATGSGGCNSYGGQYTIQGDTVTFQQIISTMMACADNNINRQEQQFLKALQSAGKFQVANGILTIAYDNGQGLLTFTPGAAGDGAPAPTETTVVQPTATTAAAGNSGGENAPYLDDRSTPTGLFQSYVNAINQREYLRAYSYWRDPAGSVGPFDRFQQGYQNTVSVDVTIGQVGGDTGAAQMYFSVPVLLTAKTSDDKTQRYAACYLMHLPQLVPDKLPFIPLSIEQGSAKVVDASASSADALAGACNGPEFPRGQLINPAPVTNTGDISKNNYLDDRSGPVEVLSSLFNAINRKEYARAYAYWENPGASSQLPSFDAFQKGYADTESVGLTTGQVSGDAGAGQRYYSVPVVLKVQTKAGTTQTFSGCYTLHLASPQIQAAPPFQPLAIRSASIKQVENNADTNTLLGQPCNP